MRMPDMVARAMLDSDRGLVASAYHIGVSRTMAGLSAVESRMVSAARLAAIMKHAGTIVLVASMRDSPEFAGGFVMATQRSDGKVALHWLYVRRPYRGIGVARVLLAALAAETRSDEMPCATCLPARWRSCADSLCMRYVHVEEFLGAA